MFNAREFVERGGLIGYGASLADLTRRSGIYVEKILGGARPADLPVEQPTKFDLAINMRTREGARPDHSARGAGPCRPRDRVTNGGIAST